MQRRTFTGAAIAALVMLGSGCGPGQGKISGIVNYDNQRVEKGWISFSPVEHKSPTAGAPITAGRYEMRGLAPGKWLIQITAVRKMDFPRTSDPGDARPKTKEEASADFIPANAVGNGQTIEVQPGSQTRDFELSRPR